MRRGLCQPRVIQQSRKAEKGMALPRARGSAELGQVASSSATQDLWLGNRNVGSQVVSEDQSRLPAYRFFYFRRPPGLKLAFHAAVRNEKYAALRANFFAIQSVYSTTMVGKLWNTKKVTNLKNEAKWFMG